MINSVAIMTPTMLCMGSWMEVHTMMMSITLELGTVAIVKDITSVISLENKSIFIDVVRRSLSEKCQLTK